MQASGNASKFSVTAPISGIITKIIAEVGKGVNNGTIVVEFSGAETEALEAHYKNKILSIF